MASQVENGTWLAAQAAKPKPSPQKNVDAMAEALTRDYSRKRNKSGWSNRFQPVAGTISHEPAHQLPDHA